MATENSTTVKVNRLGLAQTEYRGAPSTFCHGCGHDAITAQIIRACWEMGIPPYNVAKMSGIGCSSKSTAYFLSQSHGFNGVHGRMAAIATGSFMANHKVRHIGVSGDGDTSAIGLGNFMHMVRRNLPIVYIIENNGIYALTKGQLSPMADKGSVTKDGKVVDQEPVDCCALAITMGCEYVARSFSSDIAQVGALIKGALAHPGTAVIDIISPCMSFNNHEGSTKSLAYGRAHEERLHELDFVPACETMPEEYLAGGTTMMELPDGSHLILKQLDKNYDPTDKMSALALLDKARTENLFLTGLFYHANNTLTLEDRLNLVDRPLATLPESMTRPSAAALKQVMDSWK